MKTLFYDWKENINAEELENVIKVIIDGGVVIFPTDTVYGVAANSLDETAIKKLFDLKERNDNKPICVLTSSVDKIKKIAYVRDEEQKIIDKYMPGALTIILDKKEIVSDVLTSGLKTVGVRIPNNEIALRILDKLEYPLATTSANISGMEAAVKKEDLVKEFDGKVDIIIDGGITDLKVSSTIVKVDNDEIKVLRQGTIKITD